MIKYEGDIIYNIMDFGWKTEIRNIKLDREIDFHIGGNYIIYGYTYKVTNIVKNKVFVKGV